MRKIFTFLFAALMTAATGAWAQGPWTSGDCTVTLSDGTLTISGTGAMADYANASNQPWYGSRNSITSVVVQSGVTHIGNNAFRALPKVKSVTLPEGLLTIGEQAFRQCTDADFTSIIIPASVTSIGAYAFNGCNKFTSVTIADGSNLTSIGNNAFQACQVLSSFTIPAGVESIGADAFTNCKALGSITLPASVTSIGNNVFNNCTNLATVNFADGFNLTTISNSLFQGCSSLGSITIPASVTSIGNQAFQNCTALATVTFADGSNLSTIGNNVFSGCNNAGFTSITLPASVTSIGNNVFNNCTNLTTVNFADGSNLTTIGNSAFNNCNNAGFTSITLPASVTSIGNSAFYTCTNLATITFNSNPSIGVYAFPDGATVTMNLTANSAGGANWTTFYNQNYGFEADANTEVFKVVLSGTELTLNKVDNGIVDKNTAVVLKTTGGNPVMTLTTSTSGDTQDNSLTGVSAAAGVTSDGTFYVLDNGASGLGFYKLASGNTVGVGNAYLISDSESDFFSLGGEPAPTTYTLLLVADPEKGSVTVTNLIGSDIIDNGNGNYTVKENTSVTILATPNEGYELTDWKVGNRWCDFTECATALNTNDNPMTFTMTADVAYKAEFAAAAPAPDFAGEGTEASPYLIATAEDWNKFATRVSEGNTYSGKHFQLTNNIAISTMVGTDETHVFSGTFDGDGNTITATLSSNAACCAPFAYTYGATIKNLHVTGTITTTGDNAGGVVGRNGTESLTLTNVSSDMTINSTKANGGLVGYTINATISGCAFTGKLLSESNRRIGGFVGWKSNTTGSYLTITDCVFDPEEVTNGNSSSKTFVAIGGGTVTITNCYYTQAVSADQGKLMRAITGAAGVTVANAGTATVYNVSGITGYGTGILYNGVLYGANEEVISLTLSGSAKGYTASTGTLSGDANPYTLTMADADCEIQAKSAPTAIDNTTIEIKAVKRIVDGQLLIERDGKLFNAQGAEVK